MSDERLNPDILLERINSGSSTQGRLKIYLGMAAGAGKTYAMLSDAIIEKQRGVDIVAGYIEPHGRMDTERLASQLESLPRKIISHKGIDIVDFDLDAALKRKPEIILVDELAHTNPVDSRHQKRWQDIQECLAHGIHVYTTVNVQHIESLSDVVQRITGIQVQELVPDKVIREANEIELIDITPEELTQRIKDGKVYLKEKSDTALSRFFKPGNLIALRELVLRVTAERVDEQLRTYRRQHEVREVWPARPRVLVCVSPNFLSEKTVRTASRLAQSLQTELIAVSIERSTTHIQASGDATAGEKSMELAQRLGARIIRRSSNDVVASILAVASEQNANILVVGKPIRSRIRDYFYGSVVDELIRESGDLDVYVITDIARESFVPLLIRFERISPFGIPKSIALVGLTTGVCALVGQSLDISNLVMIYLLAVAWAAARWGRLEAVLTSILSVLAFDFVFVPPRWTFAVSDVQYLVTFAVMLVIGILISALTARVRQQAETVAHRERRTSALYDLSKQLAKVSAIEQVGRIAHDEAKELFGADAALFIPDEEGQLRPIYETESRFEREPNELAVAQWVAERGAEAGAGTMTLAGAKGFYVPLTQLSLKSAVLGIVRKAKETDRDQRWMLDAFTNQISGALERLSAEAQAIRQQIEVEKERVRNVLLSSVSHDFRTPLTAITGAADTLLSVPDKNSTASIELLQSIRSESETLSRMVRNVLDLTKIESGQLALRLEWESLEEMIGTAISRTRPMLGNRKVLVTLSEELPLVHVDATLFVQVFVNLLENVGRHAQSATEIRIAGSLEGENLRILFEDNGRGLPAGAELKVFDKAYRGNSESEGFGLGLTICSAILKAHGGSIAAESVKSGGARFILTLPRSITQLENHGEGRHEA